MQQELSIGYRPAEMALTLMRSALDLLDAGGEELAALHLQHAISLVEREPIADEDDQPAERATAD